CWCDCEHGCR
ncbi:HTH-type transcriptional regulator CysB, partial [Vibrio parahaemolyticus AQ3810]